MIAALLLMVETVLEQAPAPVPAMDRPAGVQTAGRDTEQVVQASASPPTLMVTFVGGSIEEDLAGVLDTLSRVPGLLPVQAVILKKGQGLCGAMRERMIPVACGKLLPTLRRLNAKINIDKLLTGAVVNLPRITVDSIRRARSFDDTDPRQLNNERQIVASWTTRNLKSTRVGGLTRVEFDSYDLSIVYENEHLVDRARTTIFKHGSRNVVIDPGLPASAAKTFSTFTNDYQNGCPTDGHSPPLHGYDELVDADDGLSAILSHATTRATIPVVYIIDGPIADNPALAGAIVNAPAAPDPSPAWICRWKPFSTLFHATHMAGIVAARNGEGFVGLAPTAKIGSIALLRPDSGGANTFAPNLTFKQLAQKISELTDVPHRVFLIATEVNNYPADVLDGAGQLRSTDIRGKLAPGMAIHDALPLLIAAAGQADQGARPFQITTSVPHSPQNFGDWENVVIVTACVTCGHRDWTILPSANYGVPPSPLVHLAAPGGAPIPGWVDPSGVGAASGTSQAAAFVTGVAADMIARYPDAYSTPILVKMRLQVTAWPTVGNDGNGQAGERIATGIVDVQRALLDPTQDWLLTPSGWITGKVRSWSSPMLTVDNAAGGSQDLNTAHILRVVQLAPGNSALAVYTDTPFTPNAPYRGVVNKTGPVTLADTSATIQMCDGRTVIKLSDVYDFIARTSGRVSDAPCD